MRTLAVLTLLIAAAASATPRITAGEAARHRGERVTLAGTVSAIEARPDGTILMIGKDFPVPTRLSEAARAKLGPQLADMRGREITLTGTLTSAGQLLELVLDRPGQLTDAAGTSGDDVEELRRRVRDLEDTVARLKGNEPGDLSSVVYGPLSFQGSGASTPLYTSQTKVLAARGVPSRTGWGPRGQVLYYGRERWTFDEKGQLIDVRSD